MTTEALNQHDETSQEPIRVQDVVESFETARGSVYTYDDEGRTTRLKTATGELHATQDIAVFAHLTPEQQRKLSTAFRPENLDGGTKVYVVERQEDDQPKVIRAVEDVTRPSELFIAISRNGHMAGSVRASLMPEVGATVFDTRHFLEDGVWKTERHLGHDVTRINYR